MQVLNRLDEVRLAEDEVDVGRLVDRDGCQFHGSLLHCDRGRRVWYDPLPSVRRSGGAGAPAAAAARGGRKFGSKPSGLSRDRIGLQRMACISNPPDQARFVRTQSLSLDCSSSLGGWYLIEPVNFPELFQ